MRATIRRAPLRHGRLLAGGNLTEWSQTPVMIPMVTCDTLLAIRRNRDGNEVARLAHLPAPADKTTGKTGAARPPINGGTPASAGILTIHGTPAAGGIARPLRPQGRGVCGQSYEIGLQTVIHTRYLQ